MSFYTENQIWAALDAELNLWEATFPETVIVRRAFQPTQQRTPPRYCASLFQISNKRNGWQGSSDVWSEDDQAMNHTERYIISKTIQVSTQNITTPDDIYTSGDVAESMAAWLGSASTIARLKSIDLEIFRISDIRHPHFVNDSDNYEGDPSFDFTISYTQEIETVGEVVANVVGELHRY